MCEDNFVETAVDGLYNVRHNNVTLNELSFTSPHPYNKVR